MVCRTVPVMAGSPNEENANADYLTDFKKVLTLGGATDQAALKALVDALAVIKMTVSETASHNRIHLIWHLPSGAIPGDLTVQAVGKLNKDITGESNPANNVALLAFDATCADPVAVVKDRVVRLDDLHCGNYLLSFLFTGSMPTDAELWVAHSHDGPTGGL